MDSWWQVVVPVLGALALAWAALVAALWVGARRAGDPGSLREVLRLVPDVVRLVRRLAADATLPRGLRVRLTLLALYLLSPLDLVPDLIPVVGYADDAVVVVLTLRSVVRIAGPEAIERHWPGTPDGLAVLRRVLRLGPQACS